MEKRKRSVERSDLPGEKQMTLHEFIMFGLGSVTTGLVVWLLIKEIE